MSNASSTGETTALLADSNEENVNETPIDNNQEHVNETQIDDGNSEEVKVPAKKPHPIAIAAPLFVHCFALSLSLIPIQQWLFLYVCSQTPQANGLLPDYSWETCRKNDAVHVCPACHVHGIHSHATLIPWEKY